MSKKTLARARFARTQPDGGGGGTPPAPPAAPPAPGPDKPDGVSDAEWTALGDPGKAALVREREARTAAEQALAAAKATPPAPKPAPPKPPTPGEPVDIAEQIRLAVEAAIAPIHERDANREAAQAAERIRDAVSTAAASRFHDPSDALAQLDLTTLTDGEGRADTAKVTAALDDLLTKKPHLGKAVDTRRQAPPGVGGGSGPALTLEDRVKAQLALMGGKQN